MSEPNQNSILNKILTVPVSQLSSLSGILDNSMIISVYDSIPDSILVKFAPYADAKRVAQICPRVDHQKAVRIFEQVEIKHCIRLMMEFDKQYLTKVFPLVSEAKIEKILDEIQPNQLKRFEFMLDMVPKKHPRLTHKVQKWQEKLASL